MIHCGRPPPACEEEIAMSHVYVNLDEGLSRVRGNAGLYKRMLGMFANSKEFNAFEEALDAQDWHRAAEVAHAIKGMTGNLSLTAVFEASTQLMVTLRNGAPDPADVETYRAALIGTQAEVAKLIETL